MCVRFGCVGRGGCEDWQEGNERRVYGKMDG